MNHTPIECLFLMLMMYRIYRRHFNLSVLKSSSRCSQLHCDLSALLFVRLLQSSSNALIKHSYDYISLTEENGFDINKWNITYSVYSNFYKLYTDNQNMDTA